MGPHDQSIFGRFVVVPRSNATGSESEPTVQLLGTLVGYSHLKRQARHAPLTSLANRASDQTLGNSHPSGAVVDSDVGYVPFIGDDHQPAVAEYSVGIHRHVVDATRRHSEFTQEQCLGPRPWIGRILDRHDSAQVTAPHGTDQHRRTGKEFSRRPCRIGAADRLSVRHESAS